MGRGALLHYEAYLRGFVSCSVLRGAFRKTTTLNTKELKHNLLSKRSSAHCWAKTPKNTWGAEPFYIIRLTYADSFRVVFYLRGYFCRMLEMGPKCP